MKFCPQSVLIAVRQMIGLGMGEGRRPDILEIPFRQGRLVFGQRRGSGAGRRCLTRAQAKRGAKKKEIAPITQWRWLLTVIHNHMQGSFFGAANQISPPPRALVISFVDCYLIWLL